MSHSPNRHHHCEPDMILIRKMLKITRKYILSCIFYITQILNTKWGYYYFTRRKFLMFVFFFLLFFDSPHLTLSSTFKISVFTFLLFVYYPAIDKWATFLVVWPRKRFPSRFTAGWWLAWYADPLKVYISF